MGACVAREEVAEWVLDRLGEGLGDADGQRRAQSVPQAAGVLDGRPVVDAGDTDLDGAAGGGQLHGPLWLRAALGQLCVLERAQQAQQVGDAFHVLDAAVLGEPLELPLQLGQNLGVEQLAQLGLAQELGQQA